MSDIQSYLNKRLAVLRSEWDKVSQLECPFFEDVCPTCQREWDNKAEIVKKFAEKKIELLTNIQQEGKQVKALLQNLNL